MALSGMIYVSSFMITGSVVSSNIKVLLKIWEAVMLVLWMGGIYEFCC
jgi:hypothetical protein